MASIVELRSGRARVLLPENVVGRAPTCTLCLAPRYVSGQHALLRWRHGGWRLKDLASRNGTFVDGVRLRPAQEYPVRGGSRIAFGKLVEQEWQLADETPPAIMAVPLSGGDPVIMESELLALPGNDDPRVTIYRGNGGRWVLEGANAQVAPLENQQTFEAGGHVWRFCCTEDVGTTWMASADDHVDFRRVRLVFTVSLDEEHVQVRMIANGRAADLGSRASYYLLLTLARRRQKDARGGLPDEACGWIDQEELAHDPSMTPPHLHLEVYRIRRLFAAMGVVDAANVVERRPRAGQLRIGTGLISIERG